MEMATTATTIQTQIPATATTTATATATTFHRHLRHYSLHQDDIPPCHH